MHRRLLSLLLVAVAPLIAIDAARAAPAEAATAVRARGGLQVEALVRSEARLVLRLRSDADLSAARRVAVLTTVDSSGRRVELARAPLALHPFDRTPRRRARMATVEFAIPADAVPVEVELISGR